MQVDPTPSASHSTPSQREIEVKIAEIQPDLRGYVVSISGSSADIDDIIQETNLFLWERQADFTTGTSFKAWAFKVAYFKCMATRRDNIRRGHVTFSENTIQKISLEAETRFSTDIDRVSALRRCIQKLKPSDQSILFQKYVRGESFTDSSKTTGKSVAAIHQIASRARIALRNCINQQISKS